MLILLFRVHYSSKKISENETALNCGFGFAIANPIIEAAIYSSFIN